ncbi:hypothetical protein OTV1_144 [Ostreococcus tauri virus 1]|uniref:hypothetical protein n=1 Tax=Ostreococcus tauri virus 1 TaxID=642926 RepID=UPI0001B5F841|nr:hypothetical protein OTV1_144 [Ostreococcus tauri virus 1]CAY39732.1 hypothetical protein OTV1_144 [Ostreococcus tauri virus 1]
MRRQQMIIIALVAIALFILFRNGASVSNGERWTVYGTMGCGWTLKQLDYMKKNGKPHRFVDCEKEGCSGMQAFPTLVSPNGEKIVGYNEI